MNYHKQDLWQIKILLLEIMKYLTDNESSKLMRCNKNFKKLETIYVYKNYYELKLNRNIMNCIIHNNKELKQIKIPIKKIRFDYNYNQPIEQLPLNLSHLTFSHNFNQTVKKLPPNITHLTFG